MSVYIIQPEEADALGKVLPRLSEDEAAAVRAAALQRVEVDTVRRAWRVVLSGPRPVPDETLRKLEERLLQSVTGVDRVTFVFERQAQGSEPDVAAPAREGPAAPAPAGGPAAGRGAAGGGPARGEPAPGGRPPPEELDEDQYMNFILERAANGIPVAPPSGRESRRRGNGRAGSSLLVERIDGEPTPLGDVREPRREGIVDGEGLTCEAREVRGGQLRTFDITG
ncbi:MAG: hypothetical protein DIU83_06945, partial [Bacillota bacterium]